jgi:hypothetical protein
MISACIATRVRRRARRELNYINIRSSTAEKANSLGRESKNGNADVVFQEHSIPLLKQLT